MRKIVAFIVFIFTTYYLHSQQSDTDSSMIFRADDIRRTYDLQRGNELALFNGTQHYPYSSAIEGIAYFQTADWQKGNVIFEDILYEDIFMKYDLVKDQLIVAPRQDGGLFISLFSPRVKEFSFSGIRFVHLGKDEGADLPEGFYQELGRGKVTGYAKTIKYIEEKVDITGISRKFEQRKRYYILKDGVYHKINNKNSMLSVLKEHRKEVQQFLGKNKLNYRRNPEQSIAAAVRIYNQSN